MASNNPQTLNVITAPSIANSNSQNFNRGITTQATSNSLAASQRTHTATNNSQTTRAIAYSNSQNLNRGIMPNQSNLNSNLNSVQFTIENENSKHHFFFYCIGTNNTVEDNIQARAEKNVKKFFMA